MSEGIVYIAVVNAVLTAGALQLLELMRPQRLHPDQVNYNAVISACRRGRMPECAMQLVDKMQQQGFQPSEATYTGVITTCGKSGNAETAVLDMSYTGGRARHSAMG